MARGFIVSHTHLQLAKLGHVEIGLEQWEWSGGPIRNVERVHHSLLNRFERDDAPAHPGATRRSAIRGSGPRVAISRALRALSFPRGFRSGSMCRRRWH
jgi:hypothetical protein